MSRERGPVLGGQEQPHRELMIRAEAGIESALPVLSVAPQRAFNAHLPSETLPDSVLAALQKPHARSLFIHSSLESHMSLIHFCFYIALYN